MNLCKEKIDYISNYRPNESIWKFLWKECRTLWQCGWKECQCDAWMQPKNRFEDDTSPWYWSSNRTEPRRKCFLFAPHIMLHHLGQSIFFNFFMLCLPFRWPETSNLIFLEYLNFFVRSFASRICAKRDRTKKQQSQMNVQRTKVRRRCAVHKSKFIPFQIIMFVCVPVCEFVFLRQIPPVCEWWKVHRLIVYEKQETKHTNSSLILKSRKILPRWTIYFWLHPFHLFEKKQRFYFFPTEVPISWIVMMLSHTSVLFMFYHNRIAESERKNKTYRIYIYSK